jgi:hypothetical protein
VSFISKFVADVKKGMAEAAAEHGVAERKQRDRERRRRDAEDPIETLTAERDDDKKLLDQAAEEIESARAERDQAKAELADNREILAALSEQAESERKQFMAVLKGPNVRKLLLRTYHSDDKAAKASAAEREAMDKFMASINAAYDLIDKIDKEAAEAAAKAGDEEAAG